MTNGELQTVTDTSPRSVLGAGGLTQAQGRGTAITPLGVKDGASRLPFSPNLLCLGELCMREGYAFWWEPFCKPRLWKPRALGEEEVGIRMRGYIPTLAGLSVNQEELVQDFQEEARSFTPRLFCSWAGRELP